MFKISSSGRLKTLLSSDPDFRFSPDGITVVPRAGFLINRSCPEQYKKVIEQCVINGWLEPVAHMRDSEYTWEKLQS